MCFHNKNGASQFSFHWEQALCETWTDHNMCSGTIVHPSDGSASAANVVSVSYEIIWSEGYTSFMRWRFFAADLAFLLHVAICFAICCLESLRQKVFFSFVPVLLSLVRLNVLSSLQCLLCKIAIVVGRCKSSSFQKRPVILFISSRSFCHWVYGKPNKHSCAVHLKQEFFSTKFVLMRVYCGTLVSIFISWSDETEEGFVKCAFFSVILSCAVNMDVRNQLS